MMRRKKDWSSFLRYVVFPPNLKNGPAAESSVSALLVASSTFQKVLFPYRVYTRCGGRIFFV
jgi:hypothetical protein